MKPRPYDIITLLGIVVLLVGLPAYYAQDEGERAVARGTTFWVPDVRYGDQIDFEIIVQQPGHSATTTGVAVGYSYRAATASDPPGTMLVEERHYPAAQIELGKARFIQDERIEVRSYDASKTLLSVTTTAHHKAAFGDAASIGADRPVVREEKRFTSYDPQDELARAQDHPVAYKGNPAWKAIHDLIQRSDPADDETGGGAPRPSSIGIRVPTDEEQREAPFAAHYEGRTLYARMVHENLWRTPNVDSDDDTDGRIFLSIGQHALMWVPTGLPPEATLQRWDWYAEDVPIRAGLHMGFLDQEGKTTHSLDIVPTKVIKGDQTVPFNNDDRASPERSPSEMIRFDDPREFIDGISLAILGSWLEHPTTPGTLRALMVGRPHLGGLAWTQNGAEGDILVAIANEGELRVARLQWVDPGEGPVIEDVCDRIVDLGDREVEARCQSSPRSITPSTSELPLHPPGRLVPALREAALASGGSGAERGSYIPPLRIPAENEGSYNIIDPFKGWLRSTIYRPFDHAAIAHVVLQGDGKYTHLDGRSTDAPPTSETVRVTDDMSAFGTSQSLQTASVAHPPRTIDPLGPEAAYGGLALLILGLLARLVVVANAGGFLPLGAAMYAKIHRDRALDHRHRGMIHALVQSDPGITLIEVAEQSGLSRSGAFNHLDTLGRHELVRMTSLGRSRHYFSKEYVDPQTRMRFAVRRIREWNSLLQIIERHPGLPLEAAMTRLGRSRSSISRTGSRLSDLGLIQKAKAGRAVLYYPLTSSHEPAPSDPATP